MSNSEKVYQKCVELIPSSILKSPHKSLCIDGTACCFKSTILDNLKRLKYFTTKTQYRENIINPNTFPTSVIGYAAVGSLYHQISEKIILNDRYVLNNWDWNIIWQYLDKHRKTQYLRSSENYIILRQKFEELIDSYLKVDSLSDFFSSFNCIALIDSRIELVENRMRKRNEGSDFERSNWECYVDFQNLFYSKCYPTIDLALFDEFTISETIEGLVKFFEKIIIEIDSRDVDYSKINQLKSKILKYPILERDFCLQNMEVHVNRINKKADIREIAFNEDRQDILKKYIPTFINFE